MFVYSQVDAISRRGGEVVRGHFLLPFHLTTSPVCYTTTRSTFYISSASVVLQVHNAYKGFLSPFRQCRG